MDLDAADYIRRLQDTGQRLKLAGVDASLRLSYDLLDASQQQAWRRLAIFPASFDLPAAAAFLDKARETRVEDSRGSTTVRDHRADARHGGYGSTW